MVLSKLDLSLHLKIKRWGQQKLHLKQVQTLSLSFASKVEKGLGLFSLCDVWMNKCVISKGGQQMHQHSLDVQVFRALLLMELTGLTQLMGLTKLKGLMKLTKLM